MPKLCIIFDLDGTLIDSDQFDGGLYAHAVREVLGDVTIRSSWGDYEHVTDLGILRDICRDNHIGIERCASRVRESFGVLVGAYLDQHGPCRPMPGANALFDQLCASSGFEVGIATGGWDRRASEQLGWGFIGIGGQLRGCCRHWYPDFTPPQLLQLLEGAVP